MVSNAIVGIILSYILPHCTDIQQETFSMVLQRQIHNVFVELRMPIIGEDAPIRHGRGQHSSIAQPIRYPTSIAFVISIFPCLRCRCIESMDGDDAANSLVESTFYSVESIFYSVESTFYSPHPAWCSTLRILLGTLRTLLGTVHVCTLSPRFNQSSPHIFHRHG